MPTILITGANGFIGRHLCAFLKKKGYRVKGAVRHTVSPIPGADEILQVGNINESTDWRQALTGVDTVIHAAARVHIINERAADPESAFRSVNVRGTARLAQMALDAGIRRFIFISSVKVNGEGSPRPYSEHDIPGPRDAYGVSKRDAEDALARIAAGTGLQTVILRLPLVYGPGVKANFRNLIKIAGAGLPLPLMGIDNRRSFLYIGNLTHAISLCITHPGAAGETFLLSDGQDVSTPKLIKMIAGAMNKKAILFPVHPGILKAFCTILGKSDVFDKFAGDLAVDSNKIRQLLGWMPPFTLEEGIKQTVQYHI